MTDKSDRDRPRRERSRRDRDRDRGRRRRDDETSRATGAATTPIEGGAVIGPLAARPEPEPRRRRPRPRPEPARPVKRKEPRDPVARPEPARDRAGAAKKRRDEPRRDAAPARPEGESLLAGRDIMGDVIAAEGAEATVDHKGYCYRRPIGFNTAPHRGLDKRAPTKERGRGRPTARDGRIAGSPCLPSG